MGIGFFSAGVGLGLLYVVFAFFEPPAWVARWFEVPSLFVIMPQRYGLRIGRILCGLLLIGGMIVLATRTGI